MGRTFLCVLGLFLLNTLQSGHAEEDAAILEIPEVTLFEGDFVTLRCRHHHSPGNKTKAIFLKDGSPLEINADHESLRPEKNTAEITIIRVSDGGNYKCKFDDGKESESRELKVEARRREVTLTADRMVIPLGGIAKLSCSVENPDGFKYEWFRQTSDFSGKTSVHIENNHELDITHGGKYTCRGRRSEPDVFTPQSDAVTVEETVPYRVILTLQSNWAQIFSGETITLRCEIEDGGDTEWTYEWKTTSSEKPSNQNELKITSADVSHSGDYRCLGRMKSEQQSLTDWSDPIKLTVSDKPQPVLTVSPSWLSPGDSVTLDCELQQPSAGWRFYWYKTVPKLSDSYSYSSELLPDSSRGTEQDSYIIHGQTHTAGYVCRAGRGDPEYYTDYSKPKFVWSGDFHSSASLTVSPDRVQHFITGSVSLNCGGISAEWRVMKFIQNSYYSSCSWRTMTGSTCKIKSNKPHNAVYWCESGSGEFSNAVNITMKKSIILVSPVHPVTEGDSVILSCRLRRQNVVSNVFFYRNGELIQNDTRKVLNISAVSKSDEGFYKCRHWIPWSAQSWMSVRAASLASKPESSSSLPLRMIVGLVCGIVLIILLLLLCHYRPSKDLCFNRPIQSESTDQVSYINDDINQNDPLYSTLLHSDVGLYELINHPEEAANGTSNEAVQSAEYSNVTTGSAADQ